ncbi:hypothetical protein DIZ76_013948 [Coccidioides immitis]|uniref:Uncharacterized protein n=1 Tax=Coccidioides immitis RMSCC 2394 TaxID=404692 RepID=A0A0J6YEM4_COCIT|nr:hypothetical protein CIRG_06782 [Coccidioides immitis RMSCC 2394]TPX22084.1 hypothetical protein DIZ76_013948 [Coccidioides immitis]
MGKKFFPSRPRAYTADTGVGSTGDGTADSLQANQSWPVGSAKESRRKIVKTVRSHRQDINPPETLDEYSSSLPHGSPLHFASVNASRDDQRIGVASANPSTEPVNDTWADISSMSPLTLDEDVHGKNYSSLKRKPSKWKKFGGLFKSKSPESPPRVPFYEVRVNDRQLQTLDSSEYVPDMQLLRRKPIIPGARPWPARSQSLPRHGEFPSMVMDVGHSNPAETGAWAAGDQEQYHQRGPWSQTPLETTESQPDGSTSNAPLLNVRIPDVGMERYSVMFGSIHDTKKGSNLLSRRSKNLDNLTDPATVKAMQNDLARPRRATSPGPSKSPTFTLFPATPTNKASKLLGSHCLPRRPTPLQKSHTLPVLSDATSFEMAARSKQLLQSPVETSESSHSRWGSASYFSTSPSEMDDGFSDEDHETIKLRIKPPEQEEPVWEMVTPARKTLSQSTVRKLQNVMSEESPPSGSPREKGPLEPMAGQSTPLQSGDEIPAIPLPFKNSLQLSRTSTKNATSALEPSYTSQGRQGSYHRSNPSIDSYGDDFQTVEVSIARSISVSKRKHMLVPIGGKSSALRSNGRLVERRVATPTAEAVHKGHRYEKSRVAVLENSD